MVSNGVLREPKQSRSIKMREKILDTAYDIFCKKGYFNTTTNEIAKTAQVSIGSVYFYFKDKEAILLAVQERGEQRSEPVEHAVDDRAGDAGLPRDRVDRGVVGELTQPREGAVAAVDEQARAGRVDEVRRTGLADVLPRGRATDDGQVGELVRHLAAC